MDSQVSESGAAEPKVHAGTYAPRGQYERFKLAARLRGENPSRALRRAMDLYVDDVAAEAEQANA